MTVKEFWESDRDLAIHCDSKEEARMLLEKFNELGYKWDGGVPYNKNTLDKSWNFIKQQICYNNNGTCCSRTTSVRRGYKIIEFAELGDEIK